MKIKRIIHIGVSTKDMEHVKKLFSGYLGLSISHEEVYEGDVDICFVPVGESQLEFFGDNKVTGRGRVAEVIAKQGAPGVHHIAFEVDDIDVAVKELKDSGMPMLDQEPKPGAHGTRVAYIDPSATYGVTIELVEEIHGIEKNK